MPSPIGHTIAGLAIAEAFSQKGGRRLKTVLWANAPDIDMAPGLLEDDPNAAHAKASHSIGATLLTALGAGVLARCRAHSASSAFGRVALAYGSHLALDFLGKESSDGGMELLWPFSTQPVASRHAWFTTIFSRSRERGFWKGLFLWHNVAAVAREVSILGPLWLMARVWKRK